MLSIFTNPGFLAVAAALVSAPIIIHLINRMRYKRLRWAAMEFLLKAQKRMRRRLIIEQLILLALRCLLVALVGLLVARFVGFAWASMGSKPALHLVLIDDTLSLNDQAKENDEIKSAFQVAKKDIILDQIVRGISQASASDKLMIAPISQLAIDKDAQPPVFDRLNDSGKQKEVEVYLNNLQCTQMHVKMLQAVRRAQQLIGNNSDSRVTLHIISDFRHKEWNVQDGAALHKALVDLADNNSDLKIQLYDPVHPYRAQGLPVSHDNVGIIDLRPETRVIGKNMKVSFTVTVANFSASEAKVEVVPYDDVGGTEMKQVDFNPTATLKIDPGSTATTNFVVQFTDTVKTVKMGTTHFALISCRLETPQRTPLEDGLPQDNVRYTAVEIRDKVPVLIVDGEGAKGRENRHDTFFVQKALMSVPGNSYEIAFGDELGGGMPTKALERTDLHKFPTIFMLNVPELNKNTTQIKNLEDYVREGGGVSFFLGPKVSGSHYNKELYRDGKGVFPVPLKETYFPAPNDDPLTPAFTGGYQLLLRNDHFPDMKTYPVFGPIFRDDPKVLNNLMYWPIKRYFQVPRDAWRPEPGQQFELAALPNDAPIDAYRGSALAVVRDKNLTKLMENDEFKKYNKGIERHRAEIERLVSPGSEKKAQHLGEALNQMLSDTGQKEKADDFPNLAEFWANPDQMVRNLRREAKNLADKVQFGDPLVVASHFGKGKVTAVMTTPGAEWSDIGPLGMFQAMIWETQNYLSSQSVESALTVGSPVQVAVDADQYKNKRLKLARNFYKADQGKPAKIVKLSDEFVPEIKGPQVFNFTNNMEPGVYVTSLFEEGQDVRPLTTWGHVFNADVIEEGPLARVSSEDLDGVLKAKAKRGNISPVRGVDSTYDAVPRRTDLSESPWFFLLFLGLLVCEQALAVHLSFHLRGKENEAMLPAAARMQQGRTAA